MSLTKLSLAGNKLFPARESLVSDIPARESMFIDIPAGDGKITYFFYSVFSVDNILAFDKTHRTKVEKCFKGQ